MPQKGPNLFHSCNHYNIAMEQVMHENDNKSVSFAFTSVILEIRCTLETRWWGRLMYHVNFRSGWFAWNLYQWSLTPDWSEYLWRDLTNSTFKSSRLIALSMSIRCQVNLGLSMKMFRFFVLISIQKHARWDEYRDISYLRNLVRRVYISIH